MLNTLIQDAASATKNATIYTLFYGKGTIVDVHVSGDYSLIANVKFESQEKKFSLNVGLKNKALRFEDESITHIVVGLIDKLTKIKAQRDEQEQREKEERLNQERILKEQKSALDKAKKERDKFERAKAKVIENFVGMQNSSKQASHSEEYYFAMGWLASHVGTISARLPDYLDSAFSAYFGASVPRTLVNTNRRTSGGYKPQWSYAFTASLKKADTAPKFIFDKLNVSRTKISDTAFIWQLVDHEGFVFGKKQDINSIRKCVPVDMLPWFDEGCKQP